MGKGGDAGVGVVQPLQHTRACKVHNGQAHLGSVRGGKAKLGLAGAGNAKLGILVHIAIGVAGDGDGLFPLAHAGGHALYHDGGAEHRTVQNGADGAVGALPHLLEVIFLHPLGVGGDGGAFDCHAILARGLGAFHGHAVIRFIPVLEPQVKVHGLQIHIGQNQLFLDLLPQDAGHLVAVHFDKRRFHLNFGHRAPSFSVGTGFIVAASPRHFKSDARKDRERTDQILP